MQTLYLVEERPCATTDYFLSTFIEQARSDPAARLIRCGFRPVPPPSALTDAEIILVRYLPPAWVRALSRGDPHRRRLVLFIDDDLLDLNAWSGTPWRYRWKLFWLSRRRLRWLQRGLERGTAELWVGSAALQRKYAHWQPTLVRPRPPRARQPGPDPTAARPGQAPGRAEAECRRAPAASSAAAVRVFYHGSASHQREHAWLQQLMRGLLALDARISFEVIADRNLAKGYRDLPRTQIIEPMDWPSYAAFLRRPGRHIGLVPLLPSAFNAARSYTKFFDITAAGAVGLYTRGSVYETICSDQQDGLLLPLELERWQAEIQALAADSPRRERLFARAQAKVQCERDAVAPWSTASTASATQAGTDRR